MDGTAADIIARILILSCHEEERVRGEIPADVSQDFGSFPIKTALDGDVRI